MKKGAARIVLLGIMTRHPVAGVIWQTLHYLEGLQRLGYEVYYVEAGAHQPSSLLAPSANGTEDRSRAAAAFLERILRPVGMGDRWAFHALHADGRCHGLSERRLGEVYATAELIINLHGATLPRPEHWKTDRLIYLETDPVWIQIELSQGLEETIEYLAPHRAFFTFGENYGTPRCPLPVSERFVFRATRQPVVLDFWDREGCSPGPIFTTVGNWKQSWRDVRFQGETYHWSKHHEFLKFLDLPTRTGESFELALSPRGVGEEDIQMLESSGWAVRNALEISVDPDEYRRYIQGSRGEFTVAKDQNVRLQTGWFSDRSATYLASGRPVITQDTAFDQNLPTGRGLFAFNTSEEVEEALDAIRTDYRGHCRAAREIAREYFAHDQVLPRLLHEAGG